MIANMQMGSDSDEEEDVPDDTIGQIFVKDLNGKTLALDDITTNTKISQLKHFIQIKGVLAT